MTLDILQKPVHNVHFELKSQSKCRFITVLDGKWNLDTCEDTTQQGIFRWGMLLTTWLLSDPCPMIQSTQSSFITLDNFYPPSLTLYIPYSAIVIFFYTRLFTLKSIRCNKKRNTLEFLKNPEYVSWIFNELQFMWCNNETSIIVLYMRDSRRDEKWLKGFKGN